MGKGGRRRKVLGRDVGKWGKLKSVGKKKKESFFFFACYLWRRD